MSQLIKHLERTIDTAIKQPQLFEQAFQHTSFINEQGSDKLASNERLEFLGDAVLELCVSRFLYLEYPKEAEGRLSKMRAQLVKEETLAELARHYHFNDYIQLGHGEAESGGNQRPSILSDCFEAFLGALYIGHGFDTVYKFLSQELFANHRNYLNVDTDYKTEFQELVQQGGSVEIDYRLLDSQGPSHDQTFLIGLYVNDQKIAEGKGKNKKQAEMAAAKQACSLTDKKGKIHVS